MKRIISVFLAVSMVFAVNFVFAQAEDTVSPEARETVFLRNLGILEKGFEESVVFTRGEFTEKLLKLLYPEMTFENSGSETAFKDVALSHKNAGCIQAAKNLGIIKGDSNGCFNPDGKIKTADAVVIAVNAVGFTLQAEAKGGYPTGYLMCAKTNGLTSGLVIDGEADGRFVAGLLYNILFMCPNDVESIDSDGIKLIQSRDNLLERVYGIKKYDGILWDNGITSLSGEESSDEEICVIQSGESYINAFISESDIYNHLGSRMNVFIRNNEATGRNEIVNYSIHNSSEEYLINADRVLEINASGIRYETERDGADYKTVSFGNEYPVVFVNGLLHQGYSFEKIVPENGIIRIAVNGNKVSCLEIISFTNNIIADTFSREDGYINCRLSPANSLKLERNDIVRFILNGEIRDFSEIGKNTVISVARSEKMKNGGYVYLLAASENTVTGAVNSSSEADKTLEINGEIYDVSDNLLSVKKGFIKNINYGKEITFHTDILGKISYASGDAVATKNYAFLINAKVKSSYEKVLLIKLLTKDGEVKTYEAASKIKVDGIEFTDAEKAYEKILERPAGSRNKPSVGRAVIAELNSDGKVKSIDTDTPNLPATGEINLYSSHSHIAYSNEEISTPEALKAGYRNPRIGYVQIEKSHTVDARFFMNSDTVILAVPGIDMYGLDVWPSYASNDSSAYKLTPDEKFVKEYVLSEEDKYYRLYDLSSFNNLYAYDIQGFDIDPETGYAGLVVLRGRTDIYWYGKVPYANNYPVSIFLRKSEYYDSELDKKVTRLYYTSDGFTESSAIIDTDNTYSSYKYMIEGSNAKDNAYGVDVPALRSGDIVRVIAKDGRVEHIERVFKIDEIHNSVSSKGYPLIGYAPYARSTIYTTIPYDERNSYAQFTGNYIITVGYVRSISSGNISILAGRSKISDVEPSNPLSYAEHVYNISGVIPMTLTLNKEENKVVKGDISDIVTIDEAGGDLSKASIVIVKSTRFNPETVIVINSEV